MSRSHLKKVFWPNLGVGPGFQILEIPAYVCGLKTGPAYTLDQNPFFEIASKRSHATAGSPGPDDVPARRVLCRTWLVWAWMLWAVWGCSANTRLGPFESDGCSLFPDRALMGEDQWCVCCLEHDLSYWQGGVEAERKSADRRFRTCIEEKTGNTALAEVMYNGVRIGGSPYFPTWYRWGYGWSAMRGYKALTPSEKQMARIHLVRWKATGARGACPGQ